MVESNLSIDPPQQLLQGTFMSTMGGHCDSALPGGAGGSVPHSPERKKGRFLNQSYHGICKPQQEPQNPLFGESLPEEGGINLLSSSELGESDFEDLCSQLKSLEVNALPLPPQFEYLQEQVEDCRLYLQKNMAKVVEGPVDDLFLGPLPYGKRHTLVLDLDETMVFTYSYRNGVPMLKDEVRPTWKPDVTFKLDHPKGLFEHEVWCRPGLHDFLAAVSKQYEILVFSTGFKDYVEHVIYGTVDPKREYISRVFTRENVSIYDSRIGIPRGKFELEGFVSIKDISGFFIGPHARRYEQVVCVDDKVTNFVNHLRNVVPIRPFKGDANDNELSELCSFLISLTQEQDVREGIKKRCDLLARMGSQSLYHTSSSYDYSSGASEEYDYDFDDSDDSGYLEEDDDDDAMSLV